MADPSFFCFEILFQKKIHINCARCHVLKSAVLIFEIIDDVIVTSRDVMMLDVNFLDSNHFSHLYLTSVQVSSQLNK